MMGDLFLCPNAEKMFGAAYAYADKLNEKMLSKIPILMEAEGITQKDVKEGKVSLTTELRDMTVFPYVLDEWSKSKQVYKLDKYFAEALMYTEKLEYTLSTLKHLPYNNFYVDLSEMGDENVHGAYVRVVIAPGVGRDAGNTVVSLMVYTLTHDLVYFSHYMKWLFESDDMVIPMLRSEIPDAKAFILPGVQQLIATDRVGKTYDFSRRDVTMIVLQLLAYLSSEKPQIAESESTKHTYKQPKPGSRVKNRWSELQIFEVGFAYGSAFRKKLEKAKAEVGGDVEMLTAKEAKRRGTGVRPHIRCAHWHRFRYGEGRKFLSEPRWMEATFVGFGTLDKEMPLATVHNCVKPKE